MVSAAELTREELARLPAVARVAFGVICAEHLLPSLELQAQACPGTLPAGLSLARYRDCVDALWAWIPVADHTIPGCVTRQDALEAEDLLVEGPEGLWYVASNAPVALYYAMSCYEQPEDCVSAGNRVLETLYRMVQEMLGPRSGSDDRDEDARLVAEHRRAEHTHELLGVARTAQREAFEALAAGAAPGDLREPARAVGQQIASWTAPLLERLLAEERLDPPFSEG